jgi:hypothetical protein
MPKHCYIVKGLSPRKLALIDMAGRIMDDYADQGFDLTLRQLYYQFVARGIIENTQQSYKRLGAAINDGRMAGLLDWDRVVDRTRNLARLSHWETPEALIGDCAAQFRLDKWLNQDTYLEVWVEKEALAGVIERACTPYDVPYMSCRGYMSQSEMWRASQRFIEAMSDGTRRRPRAPRRGVIIHLGDHDPSGIDMTRDIGDRLDTFDARIDVIRIALTMDQVEQYDPPPNPAKLTDSRVGSYISHFGYSSWELDALDPPTMVQLIQDHITDYIDATRFTTVAYHEKTQRQAIAAVARNWPAAVAAATAP